MTDDALFFKVLTDKNKDLLDIAIKKKYTFMVPAAKFITPNMLTRTFYDNHTFYECEYDPKYQINLNGKVIEIKNNQFNTYLGFKKAMTFNSIEESFKEFQNSMLKIIYIDNVVDETVYNQNSTSAASAIKKEILKKFSSREEYVKFFNNLIKTQVDLKDVDIALKELINRLENNYILIKNHVHTYYKYFQELVSDFKVFLTNKLLKYKIDDNFETIIHELVESLVFNKMHSFIYLNLKQFNADEESDLKTKMNNLRSDFSFAIFKLDNVYNECKFKNAIAEIKKISNLMAPFEKLNVLIQVSSFIEKEARECIEKSSYRKKGFNLSADEMIPMWIYVIINAEIPNILTESCIMQDFRVKISQPEIEYILITFQNAIDDFKKEAGGSQLPSHSKTNISPIFIQTKTSVPETPDSYSSRSQSMSSSATRGTVKDDSGYLNSMTSSLKGFFNK